MKSQTERWETPQGRAYITIGYKHRRKPRKVTISLGKSGSFYNDWAEVAGELISMLLRLYVSPKLIIKVMKHVRGGHDPIWYEGDNVTSVFDAIARALDKFIGGKGDW